MCKYALFLLLLLIPNIFCDIEVDTTHGRISGKLFKTLIKNNHYVGFMGIPYAAPPVKELRFKPPKKVEPWTEVLQAKTEKPACMQFHSNVIRKRPIGTYGVEDCLYLDIYTPAVDQEKRAVIIFLYNEQLQMSYNKTREYGPDFLIDEDIVIVKLNHRLSLFGFLTLENKILPGNAGLKDIAAAVEWVAENVHQFGGDPKRITLMGSQGGAVAIDFLLRSKVKKFIKSAILQSGTALSSFYLHEKSRDRAFELGKHNDIITGNDMKLLEELGEISGPDLLKHEIKSAPAEYNKENQRGVLSFGPIVENDPDGIITEYPEDSIQPINVPVMIGFNSREGLSASLQYLVEPRYLRFAHKNFPLSMPLRLKFKFDQFHQSYYDAIKDIKKYYFSKRPITENSISNYITYIGDMLSVYPINRMVQVYSNISSQPVYYYNFNYYSDLNENKNNILELSQVEEGTWGATVGDELCYLFKCPKLVDKYEKYVRMESEEILVQRNLLKMWTNFAKFGNPTPDGDNQLKTKWPAYDMEIKQYLHIDKEISVKSNISKDNIAFWDKFIKKWETKYNNGLKKYYKDEL